MPGPPRRKQAFYFDLETMRVFVLTPNESEAIMKSEFVRDIMISPTCSDLRTVSPLEITLLPDVHSNGYFPAETYLRRAFTRIAWQQLGGDERSVEAAGYLLVLQKEMEIAKLSANVDHEWALVIDGVGVVPARGTARQLPAINNHLARLTYSSVPEAVLLSSQDLSSNSCD